MNNFSISKKINFITLLIAIVAIIICIIVSNYYKDEITIKQINVSKKSLTDAVKEKLLKKADVGITNAVAFASNASIINALENDQREIILDELKSIGKLYKDNTNYNGIKIHIHTKDLKSYVRSWQLDKYGDDLSSFRDTLVSVKNEEKQ